MENEAFEIETGEIAPTQMFLIKPEVPETSDGRVNAALERMRDVSELPTSEHIEVFDEVHRRLQDALAETHE